MMPEPRQWTDEELLDLYRRCSNTGRWGPDDQLGTLNYITEEKRRSAARLVQTGTTVSIAQDVSTEKSDRNPFPATHLMLYEQNAPISALDYIGFAPHGYAATHLDAVSHVYFRGETYNGRTAETNVTRSGISFGDIHAQRDGIVTRGVLLDLAAARGVDWINDTDYITIDDLERAERAQGIRVESGDALIVSTGLHKRERELGPEDVTRRNGFHAECIEWFHERQVAVYSGDCLERVPYPSEMMPLPLHQIGLPSMGLCLLDCPDVEELVDTCQRLNRYEFLLTVAPLRIKGGTGCLVNPIAVF